ncbi:MAG TPA: AMP-binding protein [Spirochaetota bacterium]|nr:AMP-binding protein [Spirochaetota bacterium]
MSQFRKITIGNLLRETAGKYPEHDALIYPEFGIRQNYRQFLEECEKVAKGFMSLGIKRGDHVSVWASNVPEWVYLQFGLSMIGAVLVTVNTNYKSHELEYILNQSDSTTLVHIRDYRDASYYDIVRQVVPELGNQNKGMINSEKLPFLKNVVLAGEGNVAPGMFIFKEVIELGKKISDAELKAREESLDVNDTINMQYTSGTTGFPKGVMLTHYNIVNNARMVGDVMGMTEEDRLLIHVPLFHCFGCVMSTLNSVYHGSTMVVLEAFDPLKALQAIEKEQCTAINGVPTMFIAMLGHPEFEKFNMKSLRTGIMAGAPCPVETMNQVRTKMHCSEVVIAFGQTECSPVMTMTRRDDPVELRVSTVGRLLPDIEGKIIEPDSGEDLPVNTQGEIVTRSDCVMKGYFKMQDATEAAIDEDGWLHTGDLGVVDENGYFKVTGRIKDMIIRGGENVYPREIEEFLHAHDKISDVHVVGVPDEKYGEQVLAAIQLREGESATADELREYCAGKIARHKIPRYFEFVKEFPMTASGKVQKYKLRELFAEKYAS